jgi:hypothetical protein
MTVFGSMRSVLLALGLVFLWNACWIGSITATITAENNENEVAKSTSGSSSPFKIVRII